MLTNKCMASQLVGKKLNKARSNCHHGEKEGPDCLLSACGCASIYTPKTLHAHIHPCPCSMLIWVYSDITMKVSLREVTGNTYHFILAMDIYVFWNSPDYLLGWAGLSPGCQSGCFISMFGHLYVLKHMSLILPSWPNPNLTLILLHWPQCKLVGIWNIRRDVVTESRPPDRQAACQGKVGWTEHFFCLGGGFSMPWMHWALSPGL